MCILMYVCCYQYMVRQKGEALVTNVAEQKTFVEDVLSLQTKSEHILRNSFYNQVRGDFLLCHM
jgi:hypothetical protein